MRTRKAFPWVAMAALAVLAISCGGNTDTGIETKVKSKLAADDQVRASEISVASMNGVVTLKGNVDTPEAREQAVRLAKETDGVRDVKNMIAVKKDSGGGDAPEPDRTVGERIDDAGITMKVKAKLLDDPTVKGSKIDVDTREGVVYLTGTVRSDAERQRAIQLAKATDGVKDVQANLSGS